MIITPHMRVWDRWTKPLPGKHSEARAKRAKAKHIKKKGRK